VHPVWRKVVRTLVRNQGIELVEIGYDAQAGHTTPQLLQAPEEGDVAALVLPQPNFFGVLEPVDELVDWAHAHGALAIAAVNPAALAILKPPGLWGTRGADIAVGDGQPFGVPLASGGPYFGFMACRRELLRQMPGRIVGATRDVEGRRGYALTLQAREQHIRRSKATSNICTNQSLIVTAATIHLALLGCDGLERVARASHANAMALLAALVRIDGLERVFSGALFHEFVVRLKTPVAPVLAALRARGIIAGFDLGRDYPELGQALLICTTETKTEEDIAQYAENMARVIERRYRPAPCAIRPRP
jgi:glycine dehydrogenase subunit 1